MRFLMLLMFAATAIGGVIQGVVLEHATGRALARTLVRLDAVPSPNMRTPAPVVVRTAPGGQFTLLSIPPGTYILTAMRDWYFPAAYGQRVPSGRGTPLLVTADSKIFTELRMHHKGGLTGQVVDENGVGTSGVSVSAYRAELPLRSAGTAVTDDRGVFRVPALPPGKYWIRSGAYALEGSAGWLQTFGPRSQTPRDARVHLVTLGNDTGYADISPLAGLLYRVEGTVTCAKPAIVEVTLFSEVGQQTTTTGCGPGPGGFQFLSVAPGVHELFAAAQDHSAYGFSEFNVSGDLRMNMSLTPLVATVIEVRKGGMASPVTNNETSVQVTARRQSLSQTSNTITFTGTQALLAPGFWEVRAVAPSGLYVNSITTNFGAGVRRWQSERSSDWFEVFVSPSGSSRTPSVLQINLSDGVGQIAGAVMAEGKPVAGVPVHLWPVAASARRSIGGAKQLLSDTQGQFQFDSLPPAEYRVVASFDIDELDEDTARATSAVPVVAEPAKKTAITLLLQQP